MNKGKKLIVISVLLLLLAGGLFFIKNKDRRDTLEAYRKSAELLNTGNLDNFEIPDIIVDVDYREVNSVFYKHGDRELLIRQNGSDWLFNGLSYNRVNSIKMEILVKELSTIRPQETVGLISENPDEWGIDKESDYIELISDNSSFKIFTGDTNPSDTGVYIAVSDDPNIYLVKNRANLLLDPSIDDFRNRTLPKLQTEKLKSLSIRTNQTIEIVPYEKSDDFTADVYSYMMTSPYKAPVKSQSLSILLEGMKKTLEIADFIDKGRPSDYGITGESGFVFTTMDGQTLSLYTGYDFDSDKIYSKLADEEQIFTLYKKDLAFINVSSFTLVDKFAKLISLDSIDRIEFSSTNFNFKAEILRSLGHVLYKVEERDMSDKEFRNFFETLVYLLIEGEAPEGFSVSRDPEILISYRLYGSEDIWTHLKMYDYDNEFFAISRDSDKSFFLIGKYQIDELISKLKEFL